MCNEETIYWTSCDCECGCDVDFGPIGSRPRGRGICETCNEGNHLEGYWDDEIEEER